MESLTALAQLGALCSQPLLALGSLALGSLALGRVGTVLSLIRPPTARWSAPPWNPSGNRSSGQVSLSSLRCRGHTVGTPWAHFPSLAAFALGSLVSQTVLVRCRQESGIPVAFRCLVYALILSTASLVSRVLFRNDAATCNA